MRADEFHVDRMEAVRDGDDEAVFVSLDVEHDAVVSQEACSAVVLLDVMRGPPRGMPRFFGFLR